MNVDEIIIRMIYEFAKLCLKLLDTSLNSIVYENAIGCYENIIGFGVLTFTGLKGQILVTPDYRWHSRGVQVIPKPDRTTGLLTGLPVRPNPEYTELPVIPEDYRSYSRGFKTPPRKAPDYRCMVPDYRWTSRGIVGRNLHTPDYRWCWPDYRCWAKSMGFQLQRLQLHQLSINNG